MAEIPVIKAKIRFIKLSFSTCNTTSAMRCIKPVKEDGLTYIMDIESLRWLNINQVV